jgi:CheY-like chemotaxis protein
MRFGNLHIKHLEDSYKKKVDKKTAKIFAHSEKMSDVSDHLKTLGLEMEKKSVPKVLIIDDDLEAIIPIEMVFREMGCLTSFAIDQKEAIRKLKSIPSDIIVLDWMLDNTTGGELIKNISLEGEAFTIEHGYKPKVITYSGLEDEQITFPDNEWFEHVNHWTKPINFEKISEEARRLIKEMGY